MEKESIIRDVQTKALIKNWKEEAALLSKRLDAIHDAIKLVQAMCPHTDMPETGHDSHKRYYTCAACGFEEHC